MFKIRFNDIVFFSDRKHIKKSKIILFFYGLGCASTDFNFLLKQRIHDKQILIAELPGHNNLPFNNINAIGKQWIRRFALALCKETLGQVRSKFGSVPVPGQTVNLNGTALLSEAKDEQTKLRDELKTTLAELTYAKMAEQDSGLIENSQKVLDKVPNYIFVG